jgi:formylglycine-generating enzyme required for sulfatase activity
MKLVLLAPGQFLMGFSDDDLNNIASAYALTASEEDYLNAGHPRHRVRITKPFYIGTHEVSRGQFQQFVESTDYKTDSERDGIGGYGWDEAEYQFVVRDPKNNWRETGFPQTDDHPVTNVTWGDCVSFCKWLSKKEGKSYRLPTEAEWEYACRAGTKTPYCFGGNQEDVVMYSNVADASAKKKFPHWQRVVSADDGYAFSAPVGRFRPNAYGIFDMHGNVQEWCHDWFHFDYYLTTASDDPVGPNSGNDRVIRGGDFGCNPWCARSAFRSHATPDTRAAYIGFRVALDIAQDK